jgi:hypothetical protein
MPEEAEMLGSRLARLRRKARKRDSASLLSWSADL